MNPLLTLPEMIEKNRRAVIKKRQEAKLEREFRLYKGKYPCKILFKGKKKALVMWLCSCDVVGNKKIGYKSISVFDIDVINSMRLLEREKGEKL